MKNERMKESVRTLTSKILLLLLLICPPLYVDIGAMIEKEDCGYEGLDLLALE